MIADSVVSALKGYHKYLYLKRLDLKERYGGGWVLITGCTNGIGKAYAFELAKEGFNIVMVARNQAKLEQVKAELESTCSGVQVRIIVYDYGNLGGAEEVTKYMSMMQ